MALWIQAPARGERDHSHLHAQVFSDRATPLKPKRLAAGELGSRHVHQRSRARASGRRAARSRNVDSRRPLAA
ncbi:hypothetical protein GCM10020000_77350 [Streptomyces olivoverticillatus]